MATIRPPSGSPPRPSGPVPPPRPPDPGHPRPVVPRPASGRSVPASGAGPAADLYRAETTMPVQRTWPSEPLRPAAPAAADRASRRGEVLSRATGGAAETFDPGAERLDEPIEPSTAVLDQAGRPMTPHIDAWIGVLEAGGVEPPSPRGVASEMCGVAEADALGYAAVLHRAAGRPLGALLGRLGKLELKSFLRHLGPDARDGLVSHWSAGFKARLAKQREEAGRIGKELAAVTFASPRSFGRLIEKADPESLRAAFGSLPAAARQELWAVVPPKLQGRAAGLLRGLVPAASGAAAAGRAEPAHHERAQTELSARLGEFLDQAKAGHAPAPQSPEAAALQQELGHALMKGGAASWRDLGEALDAAASLGLRGANAAALLLRLGLEGLRQAARAAPPEQSGSVLQIPFSLAGRFDGLAGAVFSALGRHCSEDFSAYVEGRGLWRQMTGHVLDALRAQLGDSEAARTWASEA